MGKQPQTTTLYPLGIHKMVMIIVLLSIECATVAQVWFGFIYNDEIYSLIGHSSRELENESYGWVNISCLNCNFILSGN